MVQDFCRSISTVSLQTVIGGSPVHGKATNGLKCLQSAPALYALAPNTAISSLFFLASSSSAHTYTRQQMVSRKAGICIGSHSCMPCEATFATSTAKHLQALQQRRHAGHPILEYEKLQPQESCSCLMHSMLLNTSTASARRGSPHLITINEPCRLSRGRIFSHCQHLSNE
jgi:hypothetical protein